MSRRWLLLVCVLGLALASGCARYRADFPRPVSYALAPTQDTRLGAYFAEDAAANPGTSGVALLRYSNPALVTRLAFADAPEHTLDLQYYIWDADVTGRLLGERLYRAAERGVRVRVLLDDHSVVGRDAALARLSGHPNVSIRAFNPYRRTWRAVDVLTDFRRINRRSHNKLYIADNALAIVGGRNIADHYFGAHGRSNYRDLDVVAAGPVVREVSAVFDDFWNSAYAVPYGAFVKDAPTPEDADAQADTMRAAIASGPLPYPVDEEIAFLRAARDRLRAQLIWAPTRVLFDAPEKTSDRSVRGVADELTALAHAAEDEILIENAYLVPRKPMVEASQSLRDRGVRVRMLTNSLASTDVAAVHSGYKKRRGDLIRAGVELYELRPDASARQRWSPSAADTRSSLHTKAMVIDARHVVIGSYNLDPRSANINSECVLLIDSPALAEQAVAFLDEGVDPANAYRVTLDGRKLRWTAAGPDGQPQVATREPETGWWQRLITGVLGLLPIESQL